MANFVRKNGFTEPLNGYQIVTWTLILITVTITNIVYIPNLTSQWFNTILDSDQSEFACITLLDSDGFIFKTMFKVLCGFQQCSWL